ncbi:hypothetical protein PMAYCL1PPCAC_25198, partial [Pristionchus mayeri]
EEEDEEEEFRMTPIATGEKCNGCSLKPRIARVFCTDWRGDGRKVHTLCSTCLVTRDGDGRLRESTAGYATCPMLRCTHRIALRELAAATRHAAPTLSARFVRRLREIRAEKLQQVKNEGTAEPAKGQVKVSSVSATPLLDRRLSQEDGEKAVPARPLPLSWSPKAGGVAVNGAAAAADEEEPAVNDEEAEELIQLTGFVDREKLKQLQSYFPETSVGWLVRHADYGMEGLVEMVTSGRSEQKMRERADGKGATTIVQ